MRFVRNNALSLFFLGIFLAAVIAQALVGHGEFNNEQRAHNADPISLGRYVFSSSFGADLLENWQSEYLQFTLYILATVYLLQRGSPESKEPGNQGAESDEEQKVGEHATADSPRWAKLGGLRTWIYSYSLLIVMTTIWLLTWLGQSITGYVTYNEDQLTHLEAPVSWVGYLGTNDFWGRTLQNWQSEFLAVGSMAILSVYLRARGSPESKPVGAPHSATGVEG
jgi:Domain of unknown function (DUF6766)